MVLVIYICNYMYNCMIHGKVAIRAHCRGGLYGRPKDPVCGAIC